MSNPKLESLVQRLATATSLKNLQWEETKRPTVFSLGIGGGRVQVSLEEDNYNYFHVLRVYNTRGALVEELATNDSAVSAQLSTAIADLYKDARSSALGVDAVLDEMLKDIAAGKTTPSPPDDDKPINFDDIPF